MRTKCILFLLLIQQSIFQLIAGTEVFENRIQKCDFDQQPKPVFTVIDDKLNIMHNPYSLWAFNIKKSYGLLYMGLDESDNTYYANAFTVSCTLRVKYSYVSTDIYNIQALKGNTKEYIIGISYDPASGVFSDELSAIVVDNAHSMKVEVLGTSSSLSGGALPEGLYIGGKIDVERFYCFGPSISGCGCSGTIPQATASHVELNNKRTLGIFWDVVPGAEEYDLEWTYVDNYDGEGGSLSASAITACFKENATRVSLSDNYYEIPLVYEKGYILYRVRGASKLQGTDTDYPFMQRIEGAWSCDNDGSKCNDYLSVYSCKYEITDPHQNDEMNWMYATTYVEGGIRKEGVSYFDGTLRNRQSQVLLNDEQVVGVSETIYDYAGRPAVKTLMSPSASAFFGFQEDYNLNNNTSQAYSAADFDLDNQFNGMSSTSGTSQYYSPSNNNLNSFHAYIPDAEEYPFARVDFMPDQTGRIRKFAGPGTAFTVGSGHEINYFYGPPTQNKITRLFGTDVGFQQYYGETVVKDANGQLSVTVKDRNGRVIITNLAGASPNNLEPLPSLTNAQEITENLLSDNKISYIDGSVINARPFIVKSEGVHKFHYSLQPETFADCLPQDICYDCIYNLKISIINDDNLAEMIPSGPKVYTIGHLPLDNACDDPQYVFELLPQSFEVTLPVGSYTIIKELYVDKSALEYYVEDYMKNNTCLLSYDDFLNYQANKLDFSGCYPDYCESKCLTELGTLEDFLADARGSEEDYNNLWNACIESCNKWNHCDALYYTMLADVSPGGQYGEIFDQNYALDPSVHALSVYNTSNNLSASNANWRNPIIPYKDEAGNTSYITLNNGTQVLPEDTSVTFEEFLANWQTSWANSLVTYHPEYCYYTWCTENDDSHTYDQLIETTISFDEAWNLGLFNPLNMTNSMGIPANTTNKDPFFDTGGNGNSYNTQMQNTINSYKTLGSTTYNMWQWAMAVTRCPNDTTESTINTCLSGITIDDDTCKNDQVWDMFKGFYLAEKHKIYDLLATEYAIVNKCYNGCIGVFNFDETLNDFDCFPYVQTPYCNGNDYDADNDTLQPCYNATLYEQKNKRNMSMLDFFGGEEPNDIEQYMEDEYIDMISENCSNLCSLYVDTWMQQLLKCGYSQQDSIAIAAELMELCSLGCNVDHPTPATTLPNPVTTSNGNADIHEILAWHLGSNYATDTCNALLIHTPGPYNSYNNEVGKQLDTCGCDMILQSHYDYFNTDTLPNGVASFPAYFANTYGLLVTDIKDYVCACSEAYVNGTSQPWEPGANWNTAAKNAVDALEREWFPTYTCKQCLDCDQILTHMQTFESEHAYAIGAENYYQLFAVYMNNLLGYNLSPTQYKEFILNCDVLDNEGMVCEKLSKEADDIQALLHNLAQAGKLLNNYQNKVDIVSFYGTSSLQSYTNDYYFWACAEPNDNDVCNDTILTLNIGHPDTYTENCEIILHIPADSSFTFEHITGFYNLQKANEDCGTVHNFTIYAQVLKNGISFTAELNGTASCYPISTCYCEAGEIALCNNGAEEQNTPSDPCENELLKLAQENAEEAYLTYYNQQKEIVRQQILNKCLTAAANEVFEIIYLDREHHYTLYYYDRAGNLNKTVPPKGVDMLSGANVTTAFNYMKNGGTTQLVPNHTLETHYAYNTQNQIVTQNSPDAGTTLYFYDIAGRLVASQNAKQTATDNYSYTLYNESGRVYEMGQVEQSTALSQATAQNPAAFATWFAAGTCTQITRTFYDEPLYNSNIPLLFANEKQENLRYRVATIAYYEDDTQQDDNFTHATHYSYDIAGNVKEVIQDNSALYDIYANVSGASGPVPPQKSTKYTFELLSGNILQVHYGKIRRFGIDNMIPGDNFLHRYAFDKSGRLKEAYTSTNGFLWNKDAKYFYYAHGPLARIETGQYKVQGTDYAYTLQGWLKGANATTLDETRDIGKDGDLTLANPYDTYNKYLHTRIARDAFGYTLGYYNSDYADIAQLSAGDKFEASVSGTPFDVSNSSLYNGNIRHMAVAISGMSHAGYNYRYDQLNRLKTQTNFTGLNLTTNTWSGSSSTTDYACAYTYDANGNFLELLRNGYGGTPDMDDFTYHYYSNSNKLEYVEDAVSGSPFSSDLPSGQTSANYAYDAIGNLQSDVQEEIDHIEWTVYGKIRKIERTGSSSKPDLEFAYDALGNRVMKLEKPRTGTGLTNEVDWTYTYYAHDAAGNVMAVYEKKYEPVSGNDFIMNFSLSEHPIFAHKRIGTRIPNNPLLLNYTFTSTGYTNEGYFTAISNINQTYVNEYAHYTDVMEHEQLLGSSEYELTNHLEHVLLTISDKKMGVAGSGVHKITESSYEGTDFPIFVTGNYSSLMSTNYVNTGTYAIRQTSSDTYGPRMRISVKPGDDVDVTIYGLRSAGCTGAQNAGSLKVDLYDCGTLVEPQADNLDYTYSGQQWHQLSVSYTVPSGGSQDQYIEVYTHVSSTQCETYFDDVVVDITQNTDIEEYYTADILSRQQYYPFGSTQPNPNNLNANQYRYGFGGMEKDKQSSSYTTYFRQYDPRIARWKSTDPVTQPWQSPYTAFDNNPILYVDPMGDVSWCGIGTVFSGLASFAGNMALRALPTLGLNIALNNFLPNATHTGNNSGRFLGADRNVGGGGDFTLESLRQNYVEGFKQSLTDKFGPLDFSSADALATSYFESIKDPLTFF
ncbi:MAG: hypothetical protein HND27_10410, partial [Bacteroidetes bacterium]|nr:hypothetical protein [Bacteroidota bacterium]